MEFSLEQIAGILGGTVAGDPTQKVNRLDKIQEGQPGGIAFLANDKYEAYLYETAAGSDRFGKFCRLKTPYSHLDPRKRRLYWLYHLARSLQSGQQGDIGGR